jgi:hypothetical protein
MTWDVPLSDEEIARRREEGIRRMASAPQKIHASPPKKQEASKRRPTKAQLDKK